MYNLVPKYYSDLIPHQTLKSNIAHLTHTATPQNDAHLDIIIIHYITVSDLTAVSAVFFNQTLFCRTGAPQLIYGQMLYYTHSNTVPQDVSGSP